MNNKKVLFIASYPKSGNTFMRAIVSSLIYSENGNFDYSLLNKISLIDTNPFYDFVKSLNSEDFSKLNKIETASKYWRMAQENYSKLTDNYIFKTHAANLMFENNYYTSEKTCMGVIYLVRDPRSIIPSFSYHLNIDKQEIYKKIISPNQITFNPKNNICVPLSNWNIHIKSWEKTNVPKIFIRFEDLVSDTVNTIKRCADFLNSINIRFDYNLEKIVNIYKSTQFEKLRELEEKSGFRIGKDKNFFRKGAVNEIEISREIEKGLTNFFEEKMKKFNYI